MTMNPGQQNDPRSESLGPSSVDIPFDSTDSTPCAHLERASHWLGLAERTWGHDAAYCQAAARLAELHLLMADRIEMLGACDE